MIDFIKATKFIGKDKINFNCLEHIGTIYSKELYYLKGCRKIEVNYNNETNTIEISGSIMYFAQGHNFTYDKDLFFDSIQYIGNILNINLWDSVLDEFEFGIILDLPQKPKSYIQHHHPNKNLKEAEKNGGILKTFEDSAIRLKMYDAGRNIQHKQGTTIKEIIENSGWNPSRNYLKFEAHYKKPEIIFNKGSGLLLADIMNPKWELSFKINLFNQYKRLKPMKTIEEPKEKSNLYTIDFITMELVEKAINQGETIEEIKKALYRRINDNETLSKADKDARKRQVKNTLGKLKESEISEWDLTERLMKGLNISDSNTEKTIEDTGKANTSPI